MDGLLRAERRHGRLRRPRAGWSRSTSLAPGRRGHRLGRTTLWALAGVVVASLVAWAFQDIGLAEANKAIVFLLAVALVAARFGLGPGILASVAGGAGLRLLLRPPVPDLRGGRCPVRHHLRRHAGGRAHHQHAGRPAAPADPGRAGAGAAAGSALSPESRAVGHLRSPPAGLDGPAGGVGHLRHGGDHLPAGRGRPAGAGGVRRRDAWLPTRASRRWRTWAFDHGQLAGNGTDTLPEAAALHVPMVTPTGHRRDPERVSAGRRAPALAREPATARDPRRSDRDRRRAGRTGRRDPGGIAAGSRRSACAARCSARCLTICAPLWP